ncbi:uncharacterized protein LOC106457273 isoform X3 [Limulus polyphemus]|nr:uncharacterized protein LOC106457273 isoform X3 [Limulus polyphemus]
METFEVDLTKDQQGLGITIAGYVCEEEDISGIFVKSIAKASAADLCGRIKVNDQIIEVDGRSLRGYTNHQAVDVLRNTGKIVKLRLARYLRGAKYEQLQEAIASGELNAPFRSTTQVLVHEPKIQQFNNSRNAEVSKDDQRLNNVNLTANDHYGGPLLPEIEATIKAEWEKIMGSKYEIVVVQFSKLPGVGLGISLTGTVDVEGGKEVRPHHYLRSILNDGPVGQNGKLRSGDELLEVNGKKLYGLNYVDVVSTLKELPSDIRLVCGRNLHQCLEAFIPPSAKICGSPVSYPPFSCIDYEVASTDDSENKGSVSEPSGGSLSSLTPLSERLVKAKSEGYLAVGVPASSLKPPFVKLRSRSLEPLTALAMWSDEPHVVELSKGDRGLGFSILDYQDPMNPNETIIVIRSLVPGGVAQQDGRLLPGDRLLFVNDVPLENACLETAVQALKGASKGVVRIGVAKPLPLPESDQMTVDDLSCSTSDYSRRSSPNLPPTTLPSTLGVSSQVDYEGSGLQDSKLKVLEADLTPSSLSSVAILDSQDSSPFNSPSLSPSVGRWGPEIPPIPVALERIARIKKESSSLGMILEMIDRGVNGMLVKTLTKGGAVFRDGRIQVGDYLLSINSESLRNITKSQCRAILRRAELISTDILIRYVPGADAAVHRQSALLALQQSRESPVQSLIQHHPSPRIFPRYYRSPFLYSKLPESDYEDDLSLDELESPWTPPVKSRRKFRDISSSIPSSSTSSVLTPSSAPAKLLDAPDLDDLDFSEPESIPLIEEKLQLLENIGDELTSTEEGSLLIPVQRDHVITPPVEFRETSSEKKPALSKPPVPLKPAWLKHRKLEQGGATGLRLDGKQFGVKPEEPNFRLLSGETTMSAPTSTMDVSGHVVSGRTCQWGPEQGVRLLRDPEHGLGLSIVGGKVSISPENIITGIFIKNIIPDSPAGRSGKLKKGDRILSVNEIDLHVASREQAIDLIRNAEDPVTFIIRSLLPLPQPTYTQVTAPPVPLESRDQPSLNIHKDERPGETTEEELLSLSESFVTTVNPYYVDFESEIQEQSYIRDQPRLLDDQILSTSKSDSKPSSRLPQISSGQYHKAIQSDFKEFPLGFPPLLTLKASSLDFSNNISHSEFKEDVALEPPQNESPSHVLSSPIFKESPPDFPPGPTTKDSPTEWELMQIPRESPLDFPLGPSTQDSSPDWVPLPIIRDYSPESSPNTNDKDSILECKTSQTRKESPTNLFYVPKKTKSVLPLCEEAGEVPTDLVKYLQHKKSLETTLPNLMTTKSPSVCVDTSNSEKLLIDLICKSTNTNFTASLQPETDKTHLNDLIPDIVPKTVVTTLKHDSGTEWSPSNLVSTQNVKTELTPDVVPEDLVEGLKQYPVTEKETLTLTSGQISSAFSKDIPLSTSKVILSNTLLFSASEEPYSGSSKEPSTNALPHSSSKTLISNLLSNQTFKEFSTETAPKEFTFELSSKIEQNLESEDLLFQLEPCQTSAEIDLDMKTIITQEDPRRSIPKHLMPSELSLGSITKEDTLEVVTFPTSKEFSFEMECGLPSEGFSLDMKTSQEFIESPVKVVQTEISSSKLATHPTFTVPPVDPVLLPLQKELEALITSFETAVDIASVSLTDESPKELLPDQTYGVPYPELTTGGMLLESPAEHQAGPSSSGSLSQDISSESPSQGTHSWSSENIDIGETDSTVCLDQGLQLDKTSAGQVSWSAEKKTPDLETPDEYYYTMEKIHKKYGDLKGEILVVELKKAPNGLGISLVGNKDRTKMSVFVCGINPYGSAARDGRIQVGDELLEVNGTVVHGRCHLNASALIKAQHGPINKLLILRRENAVHDMAVKPLTHFPLHLGDENTEEACDKYKDVRTLSIKKGNHGLGIMIIEGKHAEAGQGIFVSDIQEGSPAYQAGLTVGDMILSVNDSKLIGTDYETATWILKQVKGNVQLVVSHPNRPNDDRCILEAGKRNSSESLSEIKEKAVPAPKQSFLSAKLSLRSRSIPTSSAISPLSRLSRATSPSSAAVTPLTQTCILEDSSSTSSSTQDLTQNPRTCEISPGREVTIEIVKEKLGLGLSIVGGSDTPLRTVLIHEVYPDGAAAVDGRLKPGDQINEVNGEDLREVSHERAITVLRQTPSTVRITVYREEDHDYNGGNSFEIVEVDLIKKAGRGLGLSIVGRKSGPGVFISDVMKGGVAEADGRLTRGDHILEVNNQDLRAATQEFAAAVLKTTTGRVNMKVGRLKGGTRRRNVKRNDTSDPFCGHKTVRLLRGPKGLGFSIVGGFGSPHGDLPIYVKRVFEEGAAVEEGQLQRGDQILAVNDQCLEGVTHEQAVGILTNAGDCVDLILAS